MSSLRERQKARRRDAIEAAALDLFVIKGLERATVDEIVGSAEVSKGTFFNYFRNKEEIVARRVGRLAEDFLKLAETAKGNDPIERLKRLFTLAEQRFRAEGPDLLRLYGDVLSQPRLQAIDREAEAQILAYYRAQLDIGRDQGLVGTGLDTALAAAIIVDLWSATLRTWMLNGGSFSLADELGAKLDMLMSGLGARQDIRAAQPA
jgi:AcrR family transcriptional regulator